jgi:Tfp pilus assembly protein PilN
MKAVNLLPPDLRGAPKLAVASVREPVAGIGAYVVLGALALCVAALAGYVLVGNTVKQRKAELAQATVQSQAATQQANALKPYADFRSMSQARIDTVKGVVTARFDWEQALRDISRAVPGDVVFSELDGDLGLGGTAGGGSGSSPLRGSIAAPAMELKGCAPSQTEVARLMARLRDVDGVSRVSLASSDKGEDASGSTQTTGCSGKQPPKFDVLVFFEHSAAAKALAPPPSSGSSSPAGVPVPNSINGAGSAQPGAGKGAPAAGSGSQSTSSASASSSATASTTSTTAGATP